MRVTVGWFVLVGCLAGVLGSTRPADAQQADTAALQRAFEEGDRALAEGKYAEAERIYLALRDKAPGVAEVHAKLGVTYYQEGKFSEAIGPLRQALKLKPSLPKLDAVLAMSLSELGRYEDALPGLQRGFRQSTDLVLKRMAGLHLQRAYTGLGKDGDAVGVALELSRRFPDDPEILYHTGRLFSSYAYLQTMRLTRVAPDSAWTHLAAGEANESQGLWDAAISDYRRVLAAAPNRPGLHFRVGRALLSRARAAGGGATDDAEAMKEFEAELAVDPTSANAAYEIAEMHRKAGRLDQAMTYFGKAVATYPDFEDALVGLGRTKLAAGDAAGALPHLEKAAALRPDDEVAFYQLALAYRHTGNQAGQQKALETFRRLREERAQRAAAFAAPRPEVTPQEIEAVQQ
jgi:tetratricopeptide (TPR) repeat protein